MNVTGYEYKNIKTSIGNIQCIIYTVDGDIADENNKQYTFTFPTSMYHAQNFPVISEGRGFSQRSVSAVFTSDYINYNTVNDTFVFKYYEGETEKSREIDAKNAVNSCWIQAVVFVGLNGVYTSTINPPNSFIFTSSFSRAGTGITYVSPTETSFGYYRKSDEAARNITVNHKTNTSSYLKRIFSGGGTGNDDPFSNGGTTGDGSDGGTGGTGDFDDTSEPIDFPDLPSLSAVSTGFITLFTPTLSQMNNLANYMWGDLFDISSWKKIFADPMEAILGLSIVPVSVPSSGASEVTVGNIGTGVSMNKASSQYVSVDCGSLNVNEFWGAYLDYSPYTKAEIFLPYIGMHSIDVDDIMGKTVHVKYSVDILSGAVSAFIKCGDSVLYEFTGQCSCSIPITGNDWTNVINGTINIAASVGTMIASGGLTAPMAISGGASIAGNALSMKPSIERSGAINGMGAMLGNQTPYLILTRPRQALPPKQNEFIGYPSFITAQIGTLSGYTEFEEVHLNGMTATQEEVNEIERLLKSGVIC